MSIPPSFGELGQAASALFNSGYNYGTYILSSSTKTAKGVGFNASASREHDSGKFTGSLETSYACKEHGVEFVETWTTENMLSTSISMEDKLAKGLNLTIEGQFAPQTGEKSGTLSSSYTREYFNGNCGVNSDGPTVNASAVTEYKGWLAGIQLAFDTTKSKLTENSLAIGYKSEDFELHTAVNGGGSDFAGSILKKLSKEADCGVEVQYSEAGTSFGLAAQCCPDKFSTYKARLNNAGQIGLCYKHEIKDGITLTSSCLLEGKNLNAGGHKVGLGLEFSA